MRKKNDIKVEVNLSLGDMAHYYAMLAAHDHEKYIRYIVIKTLKEKKLI